MSGCYDSEIRRDEKDEERPATLTAKKWRLAVVAVGQQQFGRHLSVTSGQGPKSIWSHTSVGEIRP